MKSLFSLIKSLAKEEKRLYNVHGRKGKYTPIFKAYQDAKNFSRELDREIYQAHFSNYSKALYSIQKTELLEDVLGVLHEYSNAGKDEYEWSRIQSRFRVLMNRGLYEEASDFLSSALEKGQNKLPLTMKLQMTEDFRESRIESGQLEWSEYLALEEKITALHAEKTKIQSGEAAIRKLSVIISQCKLHPEGIQDLKDTAKEALQEIKNISQGENSSKEKEMAFFLESEFYFIFEGTDGLHQYLVKIEKDLFDSNEEQGFRLKVLNKLLESCMNSGDFLLINGLAYRTQKELPQLGLEISKDFLPFYLELLSLYYFYENDLPRAQQELQKLMEISWIMDSQRIRFMHHKIAMLIAANLPRGAKDTLTELYKSFPQEKEKIRNRVAELIIAIEFNQQEGIQESLRNLKNQLKKSGRTPETGMGREFLENVHQVIERKKGKFQDIDGFRNDWRDPFKINLWIKAKLENQFYYNSILEDWQSKKRIIPAQATR